MSGVLKKDTARNLMVLMVQSSDHLTGLAGLTLTITASKDGAAFASISPSVTDRGNGWYSVALTTSHIDTAGDLALHITGASADPLDLRFSVEWPTEELIKANLLLSGNTWEDLFNNIDGTIPTSVQIATQVWDTVLESTYTAKQLMRGILAGTLGKVVFGASNAFKRMDGTTTAWTVAVDATGRTTSTPGTLT